MIFSPTNNKPRSLISCTKRIKQYIIRGTIYTHLLNFINVKGYQVLYELSRKWIWTNGEKWENIATQIAGWEAIINKRCECQVSAIHDYMIYMITCTHNFILFHYIAYISMYFNPLHSLFIKLYCSITLPEYKCILFQFIPWIHPFCPDFAVIRRKAIAWLFWWNPSQLS